jgi:hypothetical protein
MRALGLHRRADEKLALNLYRRDVSLEQARRAVPLRTSEPIS